MKDKQVVLLSRESEALWLKKYWAASQIHLFNSALHILFLSLLSGLWFYNNCSGPSSWLQIKYCDHTTQTHRNNDFKESWPLVSFRDLLLLLSDLSRCLWNDCYTLGKMIEGDWQSSGLCCCGNRIYFNGDHLAGHLPQKMSHFRPIFVNGSLFIAEPCCRSDLNLAFNVMNTGNGKKALQKTLPLNLPALSDGHFQHHQGTAIFFIWKTYGKDLE